MRTVYQKNIWGRVADFLYYRTLYNVGRTFNTLSDHYYKYLCHHRFMFMGEALPCFYHEYNSTRLNERSIEIPIMLKTLSCYHYSEVLEIGNVLSHYMPVRHTVVDKYEMGVGVVNGDAATYDTEKRYKCIFSISTFEHIGYNYGEPLDHAKALLAIENAVRLLAPNGIFILSGTLGYNPFFDELIRKNNGLFDLSLYYKRVCGSWVSVPLDSLEYICDLYENKNITREVFIGVINKKTVP